MIQKPYEAAVLVIPGRQAAAEEVQKLLDDDWENMLQAKGKTRLRLMESASSSQSFFFGPSPAYLYFLDKENSNGASTVKELEAAAQESILLSGWKREDIRDMLHALLP